MEVSPATITPVEVSGNTDLLAVIKKVVGDENVVFESEALEESVDEEVEEIIEIIEEVEEDEESLQNYPTSPMDVENPNDEAVLENSIADEVSPETDQINSSKPDQVTKATYERRDVNKSSKNTSFNGNKQVVSYDVEEDWQDEEIERNEEMDEELNSISDFNGLSEAHEIDIINARNSESVDQDEIIKSTENNLIYTVLGTKKQALSAKQPTEPKFTDPQLVKVEQLEENTIPIQGTIYYQGENMETLYIAQAMDDNQQYQYENENTETQQSWNTQNLENNRIHEEDNSQDQIFLHEDEDGQLYFKDDAGNLQPVYLTDDGNYAIAENNEENSVESQPMMQQNSRPLEEGRNFIMPDLELRATSSNKEDETIRSTISELDNEDNTVTISLIISEDENGQKRTQVIIPTTDNLKCEICNKSFKTSLQLLRHNRLKHAREEDITTRNFPCDLCPKRYPDQNSLARHRKTHNGDRPFQCLECHKNFPTATALRRHLTLHNAQNRPLPCIYCGRRFVDKASLAKHEQSHIAGEQKNHTCDVCQKSFSNSTDLNMHKKYHDPDKKFDCEICGREFNRLNNLQRHMLVHQQQQGENEEILSCDVCGITYKFMSSLTRHMVTTHMNPEKLRKQAEEQRKKRENNYRRYIENRKIHV